MTETVIPENSHLRNESLVEYLKVMMVGNEPEA